VLSMPATTRTRAEVSQSVTFLILLVSIFLESLITLPFLFHIPSMHLTSWLFGFSISRWLMIAAFNGITLFLAIFTARYLIDRDWSHSVHDRIHSFISGAIHFWQLLFCSAVLTVFGCIFLIVFNVGPEGLKNGFFGILYFRSEPIIAWFTLVLIEINLYLILKIKKGTPALNNRFLALTVITFLVASIIAFIHWLTIYLGLPWVYDLKYWFWLYIDKSSIPGWRFVVLLVLALLVFYLVYKHLHSPKLRLASLVVVGYFLMIGIGFIGGDNGFETLRQIHLKMNNQADYSYFVSHRWVTPWMLVTQYEDITPNSMFPRQKPPGTLFTYSVFQKLSEILLHPEDNHASRLEKVTQVIAVVYPLLTVLALVPLYKIAREFLDDRDALLPCILYLTAPNVLLMPLGLDKALYPALFLIGLYLILKASKERTLVRCLWLGIYFYIALFFSFSLVPLLFWVFLWFLLDGYGQNKKDLWGRLIRPFGYIGLAFLLTAVIFGVLLNYNIVTRYMTTLEWLRQVSQFEFTLAYLSEVIYGLNVELVSWSGFPLTLIAGVQVVSSVVNAIKHRSNYMDTFLVVFLIVYIFLNIFCQVNSEVGRTWLFLETVIALATGYFISRSSSLRMPAILTLVALQMITTYFLLAYQYPIW
jgi:hypothetical protein